jgi:hypothetical protein
MWSTTFRLLYYYMEDAGMVYVICNSKMTRYE